MRNVFKSRLAVLAILLCVFSIGAFAVPIPVTNTIYFGVEDIVGTPVEKTGDYNDMIFSVMGNLSLFSGNGGGWRPMVTPGTSGTPYWNNASYDGPNANVGNCIVKNGNFASNPNCPGWSVPGTSYFGKVDGTVANFYGVGSGALNTVFQVEVSALSSFNSLFMAYLDAPGTHIPVFSGAATPGATVTLTLDAGRAFQFETSKNGGLTYQGSNDGSSAFTAFTQTPEPMSFVLMGMGLLGIGALRRRKS